MRAVNASGVADPTPAAFTFRVAQPRPEVKRYACDLKPVGAYHDRGTRDWGPCDMEVLCPREAVCLLDLAVDEHDDSYLFNYDVHLQHFEEGAYKDRELLLRAAAQHAGEPEARGALRSAPRRAQPPPRLPRGRRARPGGHEQGQPAALPLLRFRALAQARRRPHDRRGLRGQRAPALRRRRRSSDT